MNNNQYQYQQSHEAPSTTSTSSSTSLSSIASAFDLAGHSIFISNPHQLSILSLSINSTSILNTQQSLSHSHSRSDSDHQQQQQQQQHSNPRSSQTRLPFPSSSTSDLNFDVSRVSQSQSNLGISSHHQPTPTNSTSNSNSTSLQVPSRASNPSSSGIPGKIRGGSGARPKSGDIGARAKEALWEIGRAARGVATGAGSGGIAGVGQNSDNKADGLLDLAQHLNPSSLNNPAGSSSSYTSASGAAGRTTHSNYPNLSSSSDFNSSRPGLSHQQASLTINSQIIVKPHSFTFGRDSRLTTSSIPLDISSSFILQSTGGLDLSKDSSNVLSTLNQGEDAEDSDQDLSSISPPIEFVGDPNPISSTNFKAASIQSSNNRAGTFVPFPESTTAGSKSSSESEREPNQSKDRKKGKSPSRAPFDPNRLLLKISPPSDSTSQRIWSQASFASNLAFDSVRVEREVKLSFRLRLATSASSNTEHTSSSSRKIFGSTERGLGEVIFLNSDSPEQIVNAVAHGSSEDSILGSEQIARLEGITRIVVNPRTEVGNAPRGARETDFDWKWSSLKRKRSGDAGGKCCCAFVEVDPTSKKASILSAFTFWVEMPSPSHVIWNSTSTPSNSTIPLPSAIQGRRSGTRSASRPDTPALIAALSNNRSDLFLNASPPISHPRSSWRKTTFSSPTEPPSFLKRRSASDTRRHPNLQSNENFDQEPFSKSIKDLQLSLDHTELTLSETQSDSPILRAAIANLERRTASIKKSCKTCLKAFGELKTQITSLEASQNSMEDAFTDLASTNFTSSVEVLNRSFLSEVRSQSSNYRMQELEEMQTHFETPLGVILEKCREVQEQLKQFESESKSYYSQTQKWLANKDSSTSNTNANSNSNASTNGGNEADEKLAKLERSDEKQKLRQLKFDYARVDLYKTLSDLHGGEAELMLLKSLLKLSEFYSNEHKEIREGTREWPNREARSILEGMKVQGDFEGKRIEEDSNETSQVLRELSDKIALSENVLSDVKDGLKDSNLNSSWDVLGLHAADSIEQATQSAPTRQTGHRIKHLLTSLGMVGSGSSSNQQQQQQQQQSVAPSPVLGEMSASTSSSTIGSPAKAPPHAVRKKVSLKLKGREGGVVEKAAGITSPVFGAFNRFRGGEMAPSPTKANLEPPGSAPPSMSSHPPTAPINLPPPVTRSPRLGGGTMLMDYAPESPIEERMLSNASAGSPTARRSNSQGAYGSSSPQTRMLELAAAQGSPRIRRGMAGRSPSLNRSSSDGYASMDASLVSSFANPKRASHGLGLGGIRSPAIEQQPTPTSTPPTRFGAAGSLSPTSAASRGRKKEGILWVMSKAIAGAGGADAPRAANRANAWKESWIVLSGSGHLGEYADWKDAKILSPSSPLIDLRFATVREARGVERRFCFEVVTRESRRLFQASDEASMKHWLTCISKAIESLLNGTSSVRQIDKVARSSEKKGLGLGLGGISPRMDSGDWGTGGGLRAFGDSITSSSTNANDPDSKATARGWQISQSKAFSQSLTDLSSVASGAGRFFSRNSDSSQIEYSTSNAPGAKSGKRDSKNSSMLNTKSAHLSTLSEGQGRSESQAASPNSENSPVTPSKEREASSSGRPIRHERGISNKTPVSGYVPSDQSPRLTNINLPTNSPLRRSSDLDVHPRDESGSTDISDWDFDRRIEELVHSNYGSRMGASNSELVLPIPMSPSVSNEGFGRQRKESNSSRPMHGRHHSISSSSNADQGSGSDRRSSREVVSRSKAARAAEIQEVVSRRGNDCCADCGESDPRWSSWSLSGSPCCIFICISCSGTHRSLGVQSSKVKSVDLDDWTEEQLNSAQLWGNLKANAYWESSRGNDFPRGPRDGLNGIGKNDGKGGKEFWLMKYVEKRWKAEGTPEEWLQEFETSLRNGSTHLGSHDSSLTLAGEQEDISSVTLRNDYSARLSSELQGQTAPVSRDLSRSSSKGAERVRQA